jgi:hypothetical protein
MDEQRFIDDVNIILYHLFDYINKKGFQSIFHNLPSNFQDSEQKKVLTEYIYNLYAFDFAFKDLVNNPIDQSPNTNIQREMHLFQTQLFEIVKLCERRFNNYPFFTPYYTSDEAWFYAGKTVGNNISTRFYVNVNLNYMLYFVNQLLQFAEQNNDINIMIKIISPNTVTVGDLMRPEKVVIYCSPDTNFKKLISFLESHHNSFSEYHSLLTKRITRGVGAAPHVNEREQQFLGAENNSYGHTVSSVIANTLLSFVVNSRRIPAPEEYSLIGKTVYRLLQQAYSG